MGHQGSSLGWPPSNGGGGGAAEPFDKVYAKTRRWRFNTSLILPAGAMIIDILNSGLNDATIQVSGGNAETLKPGLRYNFVAQSNPADQTLEISKETTVNPSGGDYLDIMVMYPASSAVDPNTL